MQEMICYKCKQPLRFTGRNMTVKRRRGEIVYAHRVCPARHFERGQKPVKRMPTRHFKKWPEETVRANFKDSRSFKSIPDENGVSHDVIFGLDKAARRRELFTRANGQCELRIASNCTKTITDESGEWHHIKGGDSGRCDCVHNGLAVCKPCHIYEENRQVQWTQRKQEAVDAFNDIYPPEAENA